MIRPHRLAPALAATSLLLAACGSPDAPGNPKPSTTAEQKAPHARHAAKKRALAPVWKHGGRAEKVVALTFDADMTADQGERAAGGERFDNPQLIASLKRLKVPSTVFMTGAWASQYPDQARAIGRNDLFEVANHSYSHYAFTPSKCFGLPSLDRGKMRGDVERARQAFERAGVRNTVPYFRFPGGCYDPSALRALAPLGITAVQWDTESGDAFASDADAVAEQVLGGVRPGSVVVMHCTRSAAPVTEEAVRKIVPKLRAEGYRFVKVSDLMAG